MCVCARSYTGNAAAPFLPKPAFLAAAAIQATVGNADSYTGRLHNITVAPGPAGVATLPLTPYDVFVLEFGSPSGPSFAAWSNVSTCVATAAPGARAPCSSPSVSLTACLALGCCYDDAGANASVPACYTPVPAPACPPLEARVDCGFPGISEAECGSRDCCWNAFDLLGPQCYYHAMSGPVQAAVALPPTLPPTACFNVTDAFGFARAPLCASGGVVHMQLTDGPLYLV